MQPLFVHSSTSRATRGPWLGVIVAALVLCVGAGAQGQTVTSTAPADVPRGAVTEVVIRGSGLDVATGASVSGEGVTVSGFAATSSLVRFELGVGASAPTGERAVTLEAGGALAAGTVRVTPGPVSLLSLTPREAARGETIQTTVAGANLDTVDSVDFGQGVVATGYTALSPTRATVDVEVTPAALAGPRAVSASRGDAVVTLPGGFTILGGAPLLDDVSPGTVRRGSVRPVIVSGENLDEVDEVSFGPRIAVTGVELTSPTELIVSLDVSDDAAAGARAVTLRSGESSASFDNAFSVARGDLEVIEIRPNQLRQGDATFLTLAGSNLDGFSGFDAGAGVSPTAFYAPFPTSASVDVVIERDAPVGFRDVSVTTSAGTLVLEDALIIGPYEAPPVDIRVTDEVVLADTQIGALRRGGVLIENEGEQDEELTILAADGDTDLIRLLDADDYPVDRRVVTVATGESVEVATEYAPTFRGGSGARFEVLARGEVVGDFVIRGAGVRADLGWSIPPPYDVGTPDPDTEVELSRVDTVLLDGAPTEPVLVSGWASRAWRDGTPIPGAAPLDVTLQTASSDGDLSWGFAEIVWSFTGALGLYEGELLLLTDSPTAPIVPYRWRADVGGIPVEPMPDVGADPEPDAGLPRDTFNPDTPVVPDTGEDVADDALRDGDGDDVDDGALPLPGGGGGCAIGGSGATGFALIWVAALFGASRRRPGGRS